MNAFPSAFGKNPITQGGMLIRNETPAMQNNCMTRHIGRTQYTIGVFFSDAAKETMEDKILRMIRNEVSTKTQTCDTIQMSQLRCPA